MFTASRLAADVRIACRRLRRDTGFTTVAVLSLGFGIAITTVTLGMVDAVVNPVLPYRAANELYSVQFVGRTATPFERFVRLRSATDIQVGVTPVVARYALVHTGAASSGHMVVGVGHDFFRVLGASPARGTWFVPGARVPEEAGAIISYRFWRHAFDGNDSLPSLRLQVDGHLFPVVGVAPPEMAYPYNTDVWLQLPSGAEQAGDGIERLFALVRLSPGVTADRVRSRLELLTRQASAREAPGRTAYELRSLHSLSPKLQEFQAAMVAGAIAVLLIACANIANLMIVRALSRRQELAVRLALGASRGALMRQVLVEAGAVAALGGVLGTLLALVGTRLVLAHAPGGDLTLAISAARFNSHSLAYAAAATCVAALLVGGWPGWRSSDVGLNAVLKDGSGTTTAAGQRSHRTIVVAELALAISLLMAAGLMAKAARRVQQFDFGYDPRPLLTASILIRGDVVPSDSAVAPLFSSILTRAATEPGIAEAASLSWSAPPGGAVAAAMRDGRVRRMPLRLFLRVSPSFLRAFGIPVVRGRGFDTGDQAGRGVAIVDEATARLLWPSDDPVGKLLSLGASATASDWVPVVGVARGAALAFKSDPDAEPEPRIYVAGGDDGARYRDLVFRVSNRSPSTAGRMSRLLTDIAPGGGSVAVYPWLRSFETIVAGQRFAAGLFVLFGAFGLLLAAIGLYGVLSYATAQRTRELAVRIALGADTRRIVRAVFRDVLVLVLAGVAIGAVFSLWAAQFLRHWLYDVNPTDAASLVLAEISLLVVALAACLSPALRAARTDPVGVLRSS